MVAILVVEHRLWGMWALIVATSGLQRVGSVDVAHKLSYLEA